MGVANIDWYEDTLLSVLLLCQHLWGFEAIRPLEKAALAVRYHTAFYTPIAALGVFFFEAVLALIPLGDDS